MALKICNNGSIGLNITNTAIIDDSTDSILKSFPKKFVNRLNSGDFSKFENSDWRHYFKYKAAKAGITYVSASPLKESGIVKGLVHRFNYNEIKSMIDYVWDNDIDYVPDKNRLGLWVLSSTYHQSLLSFISGKSAGKPKPIRESKWDGVGVAGVVSDIKPVSIKKSSSIKVGGRAIRGGLDG